jgi:TonB family protein
MDSGKNKTGYGRRFFISQHGRRHRDWAFIITAALIIHLVIFLFFKTEYLSVFKTEISGEEGTSDFVFMDRPFSLIPYPDFSEIPVTEEAIEAEEETVEEISALSEIGEPEMDIEPIKGGAGGGSDGKPGPWRTTLQPKPIFMPWPGIPDDVDEKTVGKVELLLYVNERGEVEEVKLAKGLSQASLNRTAIKAARNFRFSPGEIKGVPTAMWVRITIGFQPK